MHRPIGILAVLLVLGVMGGCAARQPNSRYLLVEAERAFHARDYALAVDRIDSYLRAPSSEVDAARALYVRGMSHALTGRRARAYADLERATRLPSTAQEAVWQPQAVLGVLHFEDGRWRDAARALVAATTNMPNVAPKDALLYRLGLCYERAGRWAAAETPYRQIVRTFPGGRYAALAQRRLEIGADCFAIQCGVFRDERNAAQRMSQLQGQGLNVYVRQELRAGEPVHVVLEGRYDTYEEARLSLARVKGYIAQATLWP